ncbi:MAG: hypothetical protein OXF93_14325 [Acidobacteria bacterium]|nr:hypothetical protein [Acidobacteriota bacterium]
MTALAAEPSHRVPLVKHVLATALDHTRLPEPFCSQAILGLHDAVEFFLQLAAEHVGATMSKKADFLEYWPALAKALGRSLPKQQAMKRLNQARVGLKHSGIRPAADDVDGLAQEAVAFLEEASQQVFGVAFSELSSTRLVGYEPTMSRLRHAEHLASGGSFARSAEMCALAFDEILRLFLDKSSDAWPYSPFPRLNRAARYGWSDLGYEWTEDNRELSSHLERLSAALADIEPVLLMLALGIEYRRFARFTTVTPRPESAISGARILLSNRRESPTDRDTLFAIDFVIQAALRLREVDPDPPTDTPALPFSSDTEFAVATRRRHVTTTRGCVTQIGGIFEAWIFEGDALHRVMPSSDKKEALTLLRKYRQKALQNGATDVET